MGQQEIGLILSQAIHSFVDLSLSMLLLVVRAIAELVVLKLVVQLLHLQGSCFLLSLLFLFLLLLVEVSNPFRSSLCSVLISLYFFSIVDCEVD